MSLHGSILAIIGAACLAGVAPTKAIAQQQVLAAASIFMEPTVGSALDVLESRVNESISHARQTGDYMLWRAGETAMQAIRAWREANSDLLKQANDVLTEQQRQFLNSIDSGMTELKAGVTDVDRRARDLTVMWAQTVENLPRPGTNARV